MIYTLEDIWREIRGKNLAAKIDIEESLSAIYKGVKIVREGDEIRLLSTQYDLYRELPQEVYEVFLTQGIEAGIKKKREHENQNRIE
jgi:predicted DNA binding protein